MTEKSKHARSRRLQILSVAGLTLDVSKRQVTGCNGTKGLTPKECQLLAVLMRNPSRVLSSCPGVQLQGRKLLMRRVWETDYLGDTRTLEVHICWLRRKIEEDPQHPQ